jgi:hypothetical protein
MFGNESRSTHDAVRKQRIPQRIDAADRRWSERVHIALDVVIYHKGLPIAVAQSHNVGLEGMYVETRWHLFSVGTLLEAEFILDESRDCRRHRLPVVVAHVRGNGFGLTFACFNQRLFRALEAMLLDYVDNE